jgi:hypothetical protein
MTRKEFEDIIGVKKAAGLRELAINALATTPWDADGDDPVGILYDAIYGENNDNEFTNEAVRLLCVMATEFYRSAR